MSVPIGLDGYVVDWLNLLIRWLHVIAAIACSSCGRRPFRMSSATCSP